ncbi:MAG: hypothetical protein BZY82_10385 [SAR202 cluster bacterium Io17-Chloro-G3]|nr:MAG: hypothetical protein BZY82_10385 [SAR202 cluster bacterium Io17-Chloro-G3]
MTLFILLVGSLLAWLTLVVVGFLTIVGLQDGIFWLLTAIAIAAAVGVLVLQDIFRAALSLVVSFLAIAGIFVMLSSDFLAVVQVLIYAGAISVLIIFAVLLTRDVGQGNLSNRRFQFPSAVASVLLFSAICFVVLKTDWILLEDVVPSGTMTRVEEVLTSTPQWVAGLLLREWVLPFEVASVLLLAAVLGALALVRER